MSIVTSVPEPAVETKTSWMRPVPGMSASHFFLRCLWIVIRVAAAYVFANEVSSFFYQQF